MKIDLTLANNIHREIKVNNILTSAKGNFISKKDLTQLYNQYVDIFEKQICNLNKQRNYILFTTLIDKILAEYTSDISNNINFLETDDGVITEEMVMEIYSDLSEEIIDNSNYLRRVSDFVNYKMVKANILNNEYVRPELISTLFKEITKHMEHGFLPIPINWDINNVDINKIDKSLLGSYNDMYKYNCSLYIYILNIDLLLTTDKNFNKNIIHIVDTCPENFSLELKFDSDYFELRSFAE